MVPGDAALVGAEPEGAGIEAQGLGWASKFGTGSEQMLLPAVWKLPGRKLLRNGAMTSSSIYSAMNGN